MNTEETRVKFVQLGGNPIALFPDMPERESAGNKMIGSYTHVGQRGSACKSLLRRKALPREKYEALARELAKLGYNLKILNEENKDERNLIGKRIEIPVHYDLWMRGARFGQITAFRHGKPGHSDYYLVKMDHPQVKKRLKLWRIDWPYIKFAEN